jgi:hypothetical protein
VVTSQRGRGRHPVIEAVVGLHRDERGQSLAIILTLVTVLFLMGSALAVHASVALRATVANEEQAGDLYAADAGAELGMWWQRNGNAGSPPATTINGLTVTTNVGISGAAPCSSPSPTRITGFEHGTVDATGGGLFSNVNGAGVTADAAVARTGAYSLKIVDPAGSNHSARLAAAGTVAVVRLYLRLASLPPADVAELLSVDIAAGNDLRVGFQTSSNKLTIRFGNAAVTLAKTAVSADTWYRLDVRVTAGTTPRTADWELDGVPQASVSSAGAASTVNTLRLGSTVNADDDTVYFDDVLISATSGDFPIRGGGVVGLRPNGMGTNVNPASFSHEDATPIDANTYTRLADNPLGSVTQYVRQQVIGAGDYLELTMADTAASCIVGVSGIVAYHSAGTPVNNGKASIFDGATERVIVSGDMSLVPLQYASAIVAPAAGTWTTGAVNGLQARVGYSADVTPNPYWDSVLLEVATGTGVPGIVTVTSTAGSSTVTTTYRDVGSAAPTLLSWSTTQ